jgi:hypothetical protein
MDKKNSKVAAQDPKHEHAAIEKLATKLVANWTAACGKLKSLAPEIDQVKKYFADHVRGSMTVLGCRSFDEFCTVKLKRDRSTVYRMLEDWRKPEANEREGEAEEKTPAQPGKRDQLKQELAEAKADVERLRPVGQAAGKFVEAIKSGDEAKKEEAIEELQYTIEAEPERGLKTYDDPDFKKMLEELLTEIQRAGDRICDVAPKLVNLANAQIKRLSLHGKIGFVQSKATSDTEKAEAQDSAIMGLLASHAAKEMPQVVPAAGSAS